MKFLLLIIFPLLNSHISLAKSELGFQFSSGAFLYDSSALSGASVTVMSPNINYYQALTDHFLIGLCYEIHLNPTSKTTNLTAFGICSKYYLNKEKLTLKVKTNNLEIKIKPKFKYYLELNIKKYDYFLGKNISEEKDFEQNGNFVNMDTGIGGSYQVRENTYFYLNTSLTLASFSGSDNRIRFKSYLVSFGLQRDFD